MIDKSHSVKALLKNQHLSLRNLLAASIGHPGSKGDHCEEAWIKFLRGFLPARYAVDKGYIFDSKGNVSDQIDLIIYDTLYSPLIFTTTASEKFITAESVYAVFEVKQEISKEYIEYADNKIKSVKALYRSSRSMITSGRPVSARKLSHILGGILATRSIKQPTLNKYLKKNLNIDLGCALDDFSFFVKRNSDGKYSKSSYSSKEESISSFFYIILDELYRIGTVGAVDIRDYADFDLKSISIERE